MATRIIERPTVYNLSKNEIRYVLNTDDIGTQTNVYVQIKLYYKLNFGTSLLLNTFNLQPIANGNTYFYLNAYLDSLLQYNLPVNGASVTPAINQHLQFYIEFREINDANLTPDYITTEDAYIRTVIKGGIERQKWSRDNFFQQWVLSLKQFLTWQPDNKYIQYDENAYITAFISDYTISTKALKITKYGKDGSSVTTYTNLTGANAFIQHINISPVFLSLSDNLYGYSVSIVSASDHTVSFTATRQFVFDFKQIYTKYDLLYINSLGGADFLRVKGEVTKAYSIDFTDVDGGLNANDWSNTVKSADYLQTGKTRQDHYKADAGWCMDEASQDRLIELLMSPSIYMWKDSHYIPLASITKNNDLRNASDKKFSFPIEWQLAITNEVFTPDDITLGIITTDTETYA